MISAINAELASETFEAAQAVRDALDFAGWCCNYCRCD